MTHARALAIVLIASLPLLALTVRAFFVEPGRGIAQADLPRYESDDALLDKIRKVAERSADAVLAPEDDPTGWRSAKSAAGLPAPYDVAATLGRATDAAGDTDVARVAAAIAEMDTLLNDSKRQEIQALQPAGPRLVVALEDSKKRLETHKRWIDDRAKVKDQLRKAELALADPPAGAGAEAAIAILRNLRQEHPAVVADDAADERPEARTASEDAMVRGIQKRAVFRRDFQTAKRADNAEVRSELLGKFVKGYAGELLDERDKLLLDESRQLLKKTELDLVWAKAQAATTAVDLVERLREWVKVSDDPNAKSRAKKLIDAWLAERIKKGPDITRFRDLQEGVIDDGRKGKRLLGVFEEVDSEDNGKGWRWWTDNKQRADPHYPRGDGRRPPVSLRGKAVAPPVLVGLLDEYREKRTAYLAKPGGEAAGEKFAAACTDLAKKVEAHGKIPEVPADKHPLQQDYEALFDQLKTIFEGAAAAAQEFSAAVRDSNPG